MNIFLPSRRRLAQDHRILPLPVGGNKGRMATPPAISVAAFTSFFFFVADIFLGRLLDHIFGYSYKDPPNSVYRIRFV